MRLMKTVVWWPLIPITSSSYKFKQEGDNSMRMNFWRGIITGSILGAAMSIMRVSGRRLEGLGFTERRKSRSKTRRMLKGVTKTVNDLIK